MKQKNIALVAVIALLAIASKPASALLIDFGPTLPGAPALPSGGDEILTNQLASLGVTFSTTDPGGVVWHGPGGTGSYDYVISAGGVCGEFDTCGVDPIRVDIDSTITGAFGSVSITAFDGGFDIDTMLMQAFDSGNSLLDSILVTDIYTVPGLISTVTAANIAYVTFEVTGTTINSIGTPFPHGLFFDDLCIGSCDPAPVPAPASLALFGAAFILLANVNRRRRKSCNS